MHLLHFTLHRKVYFLGVRTWLTHSDTRSMTNMEFSGAGHARSHGESHHYSVVWYSHHLLPHARCCLKLLYAGLHASDAHFYTFSVGIANSFGFISWNIAYTSSNIFLNSIILVVISDCLWKAGNGPKSCTGCQAGTANSCNFRVELRTHVVLCVLLLFGYGIARAFPCF